MSLKTTIHHELMRIGYVSIADLYDIAEKGERYYRRSVAERRMREICHENENIMPIWTDDKRYIQGYQYTPPKPIIQSENKVEQMKLL